MAFIFIMKSLHFLLIKPDWLGYRSHPPPHPPAPSPKETSPPGPLSEGEGETTPIPFGEGSGVGSVGEGPGVGFARRTTLKLQLCNSYFRNKYHV
ncbi:MAG: hypothetical protein BWK80_45750 [Desulfobacteraceae bacterium IS3]|nr:MAG: hypothetical protein BWK80_45750 [Desulfobacteraceae bacterium IS3]